MCSFLGIIKDEFVAILFVIHFALSLSLLTIIIIIFKEMSALSTNSSFSIVVDLKFDMSLVALINVCVYIYIGFPCSPIGWYATF